MDVEESTAANSSVETQPERIDEQEEWWPTDYTPGLSVQDWMELINDKHVFYTTAMTIMKRLLDYGGAATCLQLADKYGDSASYYNMGSQRLAERVHDKTKCPMMSRDESSPRLWPVLFLGRDATEKEKGVWVWKLRDELHEALPEDRRKGAPLLRGLQKKGRGTDLSELRKFFRVYQL